MKWPEHGRACPVRHRHTTQRECTGEPARGHARGDGETTCAGDRARGRVRPSVESPFSMDAVRVGAIFGWPPARGIRTGSQVEREALFGEPRATPGRPQGREQQGQAEPERLRALCDARLRGRSCDGKARKPKEGSGGALWQQGASQRTPRRIKTLRSSDAPGPAMAGRARNGERGRPG